MSALSDAADQLSETMRDLVGLAEMLDGVPANQPDEMTVFAVRKQFDRYMDEFLHQFQKKTGPWMKEAAKFWRQAGPLPEIGTR